MQFRGPHLIEASGGTALSRAFRLRPLSLGGKHGIHTLEDTGREKPRGRAESAFLHPAGLGRCPRNLNVRSSEVWRILSSSSPAGQLSVVPRAPKSEVLDEALNGPAPSPAPCPPGQWSSRLPRSSSTVFLGRFTAARSESPVHPQLLCRVQGLPEQGSLRGGWLPGGRFQPLRLRR